MFFVGSSRQSLRRFDINLRDGRISSWWWTGPDLSQRNQIHTEVNNKVQAEFLRRSLRFLLTHSYFCKASNKKRHCLKCFFVKWPACLGWKSQKLLIASPKNSDAKECSQYKPNQHHLVIETTSYPVFLWWEMKGIYLVLQHAVFISLSGVDKYIKMKHWTDLV